MSTPPQITQEQSPVRSDLPDSRVGVVLSVYLSSRVNPAEAFDARFSRIVRDEQLWRRKVKVGQAWQPLDLGWVGANRVGMIVVANEEGKLRQTWPTEAEKAEEAAKIVEVGAVDPGSVHQPVPFMLVPPREAYPFLPACPASIRLRCRSGEVPCWVIVFPG